MNTPAHRRWLSIILIGIMTSPLPAQQGTDEKQSATVTMGLALKLGVDGLVDRKEYSDEVEHQEAIDTAASQYAQAKELETTYALAQRDLDEVQVLNQWREVIRDVRLDSIELEQLVAGDGSIYEQTMNRDGADVEDFLSTLAKRLPLAEGKGDAKAAAAIKARITEVKKTKLDADADKESKAELAEAVAEHIAHLEALINMMETLPAEEAKKISTFALKRSKWLE
jgi:hypothetical protein